MKTLIIPCADGRMLQNIPLCIAKHPRGEFLVEYAMKGIHSEQYDRIVIAVLQQDEDYFGVRETLQKNVVENHVTPEIVPLPGSTEGPADTVFQTIKMAGIRGEIAVKDAVSSVEIKQTDVKNYIAGINLSEWQDDIHDIRRKSFIILNENNQILDIVEKQIRSENISVGLYGFHEADDFVFAYKRLKDNNYPIKTFYVSHIISYLIGYGEKVFHYLPAVRFEEWGTEKTWLELQKRFGTYFLDLDKLFGIELNSNRDLELISLLRKMSEKGAVFIGFTANGKDAKYGIKEFFMESGINCLQVVYGGSLSTVKRILSNKNEINRCLNEI